MANDRYKPRGASGGKSGGGRGFSGSRGGKPGYGEKSDGGYKPAYGGGKSEGGYKPGYGGKSEGGYKSNYGGKSEGGYKPGYGGKSEGGYKPGYGGGRSEGGYKSNYGGGKSEGGYKPAYGGKSEGGYKPGYGGGKSEGGYKPGYGGKSEGGYKPGYGGKSKPAYNGERQTRPFERRNDGVKDAPYRERRPAFEVPEAPAQTGGEDELPYLIIGRNAVREAVKSGRSIDRILVQTEPDGSLSETVNMARDKKLVIREVDRKKLDELCMPFGHGGKTANHQGIVAYAAGVSYVEVSDMLALAKERGEQPFLIVLDGVQDPHNLGAIIRSADCAGAHGVIIGKRRAASVTSAAVKAAAGATEHVLISRVTNISETLEKLKEQNVWIAGADMSGAPMGTQALSGALALVVGGEGEGLSKLVRERCDFLVCIPMSGHVGSLNASVAAAVLMFEKRRQDACQ